MASVNKVILVGNLGRDPEVRYSPDGAAICNVSLATTTQWKDKQSGEKREETEWHRLVFYNRLAEVAGGYLRKGREIYVEGKLKTRKWQDKDTGEDRYSTEIVADQMQMLGGRDSGGAGDEPSGRPQQTQRPAQRQQPASKPASNNETAGGMADLDSDTPFMRMGHGRMWSCI